MSHSEIISCAVLGATVGGRNASIKAVSFSSQEGLSGLIAEPVGVWVGRIFLGAGQSPT